VRVPLGRGEAMHLHSLVAEFAEPQELPQGNGPRQPWAQHVVQLWPGTLPSQQVARQQAKAQAAQDPLDRAVLDMVGDKERPRKRQRKLGAPRRAAGGCDDMAPEGSPSGCRPTVAMPPSTRFALAHLGARRGFARKVVKRLRIKRFITLGGHQGGSADGEGLGRHG
jgi:hypothetical protein